LGKNLDVVGLGDFTATGDIKANSGKLQITTQGDIYTQKLESVNQFISLISLGAVDVEGEIFSGNRGIAITAAKDITTQQINSLNGVVSLSSYEGSVMTGILTR
jgi:hypothetical protein